MYRIAVLTDNQSLGKQLIIWTKCFCMEHGLFPTVELYKDLEMFHNAVKKSKPNGVIITMSGVAGLNASEHLRSLCPDCGLIWCSDLDFSLHAYRLRAEYFIKAPLTNEELCKGLSFWLECRHLRRQGVKNQQVISGA